MKIIELLEVDSTNRYLFELGKKKEFENGLTVVAQRQTRGKGRTSRSWTSPKEGLYASTIRTEDKGTFPLITAIGVARALNSLGFEAKIKWPNDIIINKKKVCGILCESMFLGSKREFTVNGFGINVNNEGFEEEIEKKATSLFLESGIKQDKIKLLKLVLKQIEDIIKNTDEEIIEEYKSLCLTLNKRVKIVDEDKVVFAKDIDISGGLVVTYDDMTTKILHYGDVSVRGINNEYV